MTVSVALLLPVADGVKVIPIVHEALAANWPLNVLHVSEPIVSTNSVPVMEIEKVNTALLALTSVTVWGALVVVFACPPKFTLVGVTLAPVLPPV